MEVTSFKLLSRLCSRIGRVLGIVCLSAVSLVAGCKTFVRIDAPVGIPGKDVAIPRFCVVDCILETHKNFAVFPGERGGSYSQKVENLQSALEAACPEWFEHGPDAIPLCVKICADVTDYRGTNPLVSFPSMLTFGFVPMKTAVFFNLSTAMQLSPGEWCDAIPIAAKKELMASNLSSFAPSSKGWRAFREPFSELEDGESHQQVAVISQVGQFSLMQDLKDGDGPGGVDPHFATILARLIAGTWDDLSFDEKQRVRRNPMAAKLKAELYPETKDPMSSSNTGVAVGKAMTGSAPDVSVTPSIAGYGYNKASCRGYVEVSKNGAEHLAALKWVRTEAIPKIAGAGVSIRILSERTLENGNSRIDFEVAQ